MPINKAVRKRIDKIYCDDCVILCDNRNHPIRTCRETIDKMIAEIEKPNDKKAKRGIMDMVQIWHKYLEALAKYIASRKDNKK
jgi:hypothetical protein